MLLSEIFARVVSTMTFLSVVSVLILVVAVFGLVRVRVRHNGTRAGNRPIAED